MVLPPLEGGMKEAGFTDIRTSINNRQNTVVQIHCNATVSGSLQGYKPDRGVEDGNEVVGSKVD